MPKSLINERSIN